MGVADVTYFPLSFHHDAGSGDAFVAAALLHNDKLDSRHEAANSYSEAAQVYKKVKPDSK